MLYDKGLGNIFDKKADIIYRLLDSLSRHNVVYIALKFISC